MFPSPFRTYLTTCSVLKVGSWILNVADFGPGLKVFHDMWTVIKAGLLPFTILTLERLQGNNRASSTLEFRGAVVWPCFTTSQKTRRNVCNHGTASRKKFIVQSISLNDTSDFFFQSWQLIRFCCVLSDQYDDVPHEYHRHQVSSIFFFFTISLLLGLKTWADKTRQASNVSNLTALNSFLLLLVTQGRCLHGCGAELV